MGDSIYCCCGRGFLLGWQAHQLPFHMGSEQYPGSIGSSCVRLLGQLPQHGQRLTATSSYTASMLLGDAHLVRGENLWQERNRACWQASQMRCCQM